VSSSFLMQAGISLESAPVMQVKVANGQLITSSQQVTKLEWWAQGHTFHSAMRVFGHCSL
jgi:hypothetical protein